MLSKSLQRRIWLLFFFILFLSFCKRKRESSPGMTTRASAVAEHLYGAALGSYQCQETDDSLFISFSTLLLSAHNKERKRKYELVTEVISISWLVLLSFFFHINVLWEERKEMKLNLKMIPSVSSNQEKIMKGNNRWHIVKRQKEVPSVSFHLFLELTFRNHNRLRINPVKISFNNKWKQLIKNEFFKISSEIIHF